jgi:hypothetical protein
MAGWRNHALNKVFLSKSQKQGGGDLSNNQLSKAVGIKKICLNMRRRWQKTVLKIIARTALDK